MYSSLLLIYALISGVVSADISQDSASDCTSSNFFKACVSNNGWLPETCNSRDYKCLCDAYNQVLSCYNTCPTGPGRVSLTQNRDQACIAAGATSPPQSTMSVNNNTMSNNNSVNNNTMSNNNATTTVPAKTNPTPTTSSPSPTASTSKPTPTSDGFKTPLHWVICVSSFFFSSLFIINA